LIIPQVGIQGGWGGKKRFCRGLKLFNMGFPGLVGAHAAGFLKKILQSQGRQGM